MDKFHLNYVIQFVSIGSIDGTCPPWLIYLYTFSALDKSNCVKIDYTWFDKFNEINKAMDDTTTPIQLNHVYTHLLENIHFDCLSDELLSTIFKDGRAFSHFIEPWLANKYPLTHITGCKKYDHVDKYDETIQYDQKTFTSRGCYFMPSNMIGEGRKFDQSIFEEKAKNLTYIIVSNVHFPEIKIKFVKGTELAAAYPKGSIPSKDYVKFFD